MFEQQVAKKTTLPLKVLAAFAVGAVLGFGLCTAGAMFGGGQRGWGNAAVFGAGCCVVCVLGVVGSIIWWLVANSRR